MHQLLVRVMGDVTWVFSCSEFLRCCGAEVTVVGVHGAATICFRVRVLVSTIAVIGAVVVFCIATSSCSTQFIPFLANDIDVLFLCVILVYVVRQDSRLLGRLNSSAAPKRSLVYRRSLSSFLTSVAHVIFGSNTKPLAVGFDV